MDCDITYSIDPDAGTATFSASTEKGELPLGGAELTVPLDEAAKIIADAKAPGLGGKVALKTPAVTQRRPWIRFGGAGLPQPERMERHWRVVLSRDKGEILGTVEAPDAEGAKVAAAVQFNLDEIRRNRITNAMGPLDNGCS
jgi:hypothetical protein